MSEPIYNAENDTVIYLGREGSAEEFKTHCLNGGFFDIYDTVCKFQEERRQNEHPRKTN